MLAIYNFKINSKHRIVFMMLMIFYFNSSAQNFELTGFVRDVDNNEKLSGVVVLVNNKIKAVTDAKGFYQLHLNQGEYEIIFKYTGYTDKKESISIHSNLQHDIKLKVSTSQLNQVVVSAGRYEQEVKRLTVSTEIIKPYLIENKITTNLQNFMDQVPSVNVIDGQINIRGGSGWTYGAGSRVLVMLDDMPYLSGDAGQVQWKFLPTENIQQIEVVKGASSVLYGSSALNGVINIRTADPKDKPITSLTPIFGWYNKPSRDSLKWTNNTQLQKGFNAFHSRVYKQLDLTFTANYLKDDGYRFGEDDERLRFSFKTKFHSKKFAGLTYGLNGSMMYQNSSSFLLWNGYPQGGLVALSNQKTMDKSYNFSIDPHVDFFAFGLKHRIKTRYLNIINNIQSPDTTVNQDNSSWLVYGEYQVQKELPKQLGVITGGIAGSYTESNSPLYMGFNHSANYAPFLQLDLRYKKISFTAGSRYENYQMNSQKDSRVIFRTGLNIEITKTTFFRTSYGEGYRYPSIAERYIQTSVGAVNVFPNPNLKPESGWNAEAGIKQGFKISNWTCFADAAYFYTEYANMVEFNFGVWAPIDPTGPIGNIFKSFGFKSFNVGQTRIDGFDFSLGGQGKIGSFDVKILAGYTLMNPISLEPEKIYAYDLVTPPNPLTYSNTSSSADGNFLKYRYKELGKTDVQIGYKKYSFGVSMRYNSFMKNIDKIFIDPLFATLVPGVANARELNSSGDFIWDLRFGYELNKHIKTNFIVNNLLNHEMMTRPTDIRPPRLFMFQINFRF